MCKSDLNIVISFFPPGTVSYLEALPGVLEGTLKLTCKFGESMCAHKFYRKISMEVLTQFSGIVLAIKALLLNILR